MQKKIIPGFKFNRSILLYVVFAMICYIYFLAATIPAGFVINKFVNYKQVKLENISGSVWNGQSANTEIAGIAWGKLSWEINPVYFLLGQLSLSMELGQGEQYFQSDVALYPSGKIKLENADISIPLSALQKFTYGMPFSYTGMVKGNFPVVTILKNNYFMLDGDLRLQSLQVTSPQKMSFGTLNVNFKSVQDGASVGKISDTGGPLGISGSIDINNKSLANLSAKLNARKAGSDLDKVLGFLGNKDASGRVSFNYRYMLMP